MLEASSSGSGEQRHTMSTNRFMPDNSITPALARVSVRLQSRVESYYFLFAMLLKCSYVNYIGCRAINDVRIQFSIRSLNSALTFSVCFKKMQLLYTQ